MCPIVNYKFVCTKVNHLADTDTDSLWTLMSNVTQTKEKLLLKKKKFTPGLTCGL